MDVKNRYKEKDEELFRAVTAFRNGDASKSTDIYHLSNKYLYKIIFDITKNTHVTEDLLQDTYLVIFDKVETLLDPTAFYVWAGRIATNKTLRYIQREKKMLLNLDEGDDEGKSAGAVIMDKASMDHEEFIPESILMDNEKQRLLMDIIDNLSVAQKLCIQYYYYEEMSVKAIATQMECSEGTIKSRLNYARNAIKEAVLDLEQNHGTKLYSLAGIPLFYFLFRESVLHFTLPATAGVGASAATAAGKVNVTNQTNQMNQFELSQGVKTLAANSAKKAGLSVGAKIAITAATFAVVVGGAFGGYKLYLKATGNDLNESQEKIVNETYKNIADTYVEMGVTKKQVAVTIESASYSDRKVYDQLDRLLEAYQAEKDAYANCIDSNTYEVIEEELFNITDQAISLAVIGTEDFIGMSNEYGYMDSVNDLRDKYIELLDVETKMLWAGVELLNHPKSKELLDSYVSSGGSIIDDMRAGANLPTIIFNIANTGNYELNQIFIDNANTLSDLSYSFMTVASEYSQLASTEEMLSLSSQYAVNNNLQDKEYYKQLQSYYNKLVGSDYGTSNGSNNNSGSGNNQYACPNCGGTGWVSQFIGNDANGLPMYSDVICGGCSGQGWLSY